MHKSIFIVFFTVQFGAFWLAM